MRIFVDIENKKLVQGLSTDRSVPTPLFMQGDNEPIELHLLKSGESTLYEDLILDKASDILRIAIARFKGDPKILSFIAEYEPLENGGALVVLPLNTSEIESALGNNQAIDAFLEIEYATTNGRITTILQTPCKVKNDLIENAPSVEIQEQFYDKAITDTLFLQKQDNLASIENKGTARGNINVYSKDEVDEFQITNLTKSDNLASLENLDTARNNLNAVSSTQYEVDRRTMFHNYGVYSRYGFSCSSYYGSGLGAYSPSKFTVLATVLSKSSSFTLLSNEYSNEYGIYLSGKNLNYGYTYDYSDENYNSISFDLPLTKAVEYGDKLAITLDNKILSVYKNAELIGQGEIDSRANIYNPSYLLSYDGIKRDFAYSSNFVLPATVAQGVASIYKYSIEDWVNGKPIPFSLLYGLRGGNHTSFPTKFGGVSNFVALAPKTQAGIYNAQLLYATTSTSIPANTNYIIHPKTGRGQYSYGSLTIDAMYNLYCGGTVTLIFQKVNI